MACPGSRDNTNQLEQFEFKCRVFAQHQTFSNPNFKRMSFKEYNEIRICSSLPQHIYLILLNYVLYNMKLF